MPIAFTEPLTGTPLERVNDQLVRKTDGKVVAIIVNGIPRFTILHHKNYADSFGWQHNYWEDNRSPVRNPAFGLKQVVMERTHFGSYDLSGKTILECGCGGGDDTEVLLMLPFSEVHSFDLSNSVDRARHNIKDERLVLSQASITEIPYADESFDVVYCHRVLQHTPDPVASLKAICKKVKPGGLLFAHSYRSSKRYLSEWRYKYRWLTKRLPKRVIYWYLQLFAFPLHFITLLAYKNRYTWAFAYRFIPYFLKKDKYSRNLPLKEVLELEKYTTFDALTPAYDSPMTLEDFYGTLEAEGFAIEHRKDKVSLIYCTARKKQ